MVFAGRKFGVQVVAAVVTELAWAVFPAADYKWASGVGAIDIVSGYFPDGRRYR